MNPLTQTRNLTKLIEREVKLEVKESASWHKQYKDSAWIFVGGLAYELTEGDIIAVFSQYGEIVNINLVRDHKTGKSKGYCFLCYEDQRSTVLAVDNFNGIKLCKRIIRVDHVENYRVPKEYRDTDEETKKLRDEGCAPDVMLKTEDAHKSKEGTPPSESFIKKEKHDPGYDKYERHQSESRKSSRKDSKTRGDRDSREREIQKRHRKDENPRSDRQRHDYSNRNKNDEDKHESQSKNRKRNDDSRKEKRNEDEHYNDRKRDRRNDKESHNSRSKDDNRKESRNEAKYERQSPSKDHNKNRERENEIDSSNEYKSYRRKR